MPELPEVETVVRGLERLTAGQQVQRVTVFSPRSWRVTPAEQAALLGATIVVVRRRGKLIIIELNNGWSLLCHLRMTGQLVWRPQQGEAWGAGHPNESLVGTLPDNTTRVALTLTAGTLYFNDQRKFGFMLMWRTAELNNFPFIQQLGPEPLVGNPTKEFIQRIRRHAKTSVKAALLNQAVLAGVGNIYADESLYRARLHPATKVEALSDDQLAALLAAVQAVMRQSIAAGGSSLRNYVHADGTRGDYLDLFAAVFNRTGQPCRRCGTEIIKIKVAGRGTHLCPHCQPAPRKIGQ